MPSWQSHVLSLLARTLIKRKVMRRTYSVDSIIHQSRKLLAPSRWKTFGLPSEVSYEKFDLGQIRGERLWVDDQPEETKGGCIYYLHGGGYITGSPDSHRKLTAALTASSQMPTFSLDYRLAPEHPYPAAVEDAVAGYRWLLDEGYSPERIFIGGDSAGGGLTMATVLWLRDAGLPLPAGVFLLSPWTDLACTGNSLLKNDPHDHLLCGKEVHRFSKVYYGDGSPYDPLVSPLYADFSSLPPLRIYVSDTEILLDDSVRLAERARCYGVEVDLRIWKNLIHAWPVMMGFRLPEAKQVVRELAQFIEERLKASRSIGKAA